VLSATSDYALRAILVLARAHGLRLLRADEIAETTAAPRNYMAKTLNALAKAGIVTSTRGPQGGFALAIEPEKLTLARVIDCFDEPRLQLRCLLGSKACDPANACAAHHRWASIKDARRTPLAGTTIADLLGTATPGGSDLRTAPSHTSKDAAGTAARVSAPVRLSQSTSLR
jgi:Rrf2 family protein